MWAVQGGRRLDSSHITEITLVELSHGKEEGSGILTDNHSVPGAALEGFSVGHQQEVGLDHKLPQLGVSENGTTPHLHM